MIMAKTTTTTSQTPTQVAYTHAFEGMETSSLAICIVGELLDFLYPLRELGKVDALDNQELRKRCKCMEGLAQMAIRHGEHMDGLLGTINRGHQKDVAAMEAAREEGAA